MVLPAVGIFFTFLYCTRDTHHTPGKDIPGVVLSDTYHLNVTCTRMACRDYILLCTVYNAVYDTPQETIKRITHRYK